MSNFWKLIFPVNRMSDSYPLRLDDCKKTLSFYFCIPVQDLRYTYSYFYGHKNIATQRLARGLFPSVNASIFRNLKALNYQIQW